jgi:hypothetical protein
VQGNNCDFAIDSVAIELEGSGNSADGLANPTGIDTGSDGFDDARGLVTILGWSDGRLEVSAVAEHDLGTVEPESFHAETDFARAGLRKWKLIELEDFSGTRLVEANDLYGVGHTYPWITDSSLRWP